MRQGTRGGALASTIPAGGARGGVVGYQILDRTTALWTHRLRGHVDLSHPPTGPRASRCSARFTRIRGRRVNRHRCRGHTGVDRSGTVLTREPAWAAQDEETTQRAVGHHAPLRSLGNVRARTRVPTLPFRITARNVSIRIRLSQAPIGPRFHRKSAATLPSREYTQRQKWDLGMGTSVLMSSFLAPSLWSPAFRRSVGNASIRVLT